MIRIQVMSSFQHAGQTDQSGHHALHWEPPQRLLIAHDQQLAHLDGGLKLLRLIAGGLQALEELLSLGA